MTYIEELQDVIRKLHGVHSTHIQSVPVKEEFQGKTVWEGIVEVFQLHDHPKATHAYAWTHETDDPKRPKRSVTVLKIPPAVSPETAVRTALIRSTEVPKQPKKRKPGRPKLPKDQAKGKIVPVRFAAEELQRVYRAAEKADQTVSQWIRSTLTAATEG